MTLQIPKVIPHDWNRLRVIVDKLKHLRLGNDSNPTFASLNLTDNTGLIDADGSTFLANDGTGNIFLGEDAFNDNTGSYNIGIGYQAGYYNDLTGGGSRGTYNIYIGYLAGNGAAAGNTGYHNLAIGALSLDANTSGYQNVALSGVNALRANTSGYQNIAIGFDALRNNTEGYANIAIGIRALSKITSGPKNIAIGWECLRDNVTGDNNVAIGWTALTKATGVRNMAFGANSLKNIIAGEENTAAGSATFSIVTEANRCIALGYAAGNKQTGIINDLLFIDNQIRANAAEELTNAIVYGVMAAAPANQTLRFNAKVIITDLTASRLIASDGSKTLKSVANLTSWIAQTANQVLVADDGDGSITLSLPQDIHAGASPTFAGLTLSGNLIIPDGGNIGSVSDTDAIQIEADGDVVLTQKLGLGVSPARKFEIGSNDNSNRISIYHDNTNAHIKTSAGDIEIQADVVGNVVLFSGTDVANDEDGKYFRIFRRAPEGDNYLDFRISKWRSFLLQYVGGSMGFESTTNPVRLQYSAYHDVYMFDVSIEGRTKELKIYGYRTGDVKRSLEIGVGVDADDTVSFDGLSNYWFDGTIKSTGGAMLGDGGITNYTEIEADGTIKFNGAATVFNDIIISLSSAKVPPANAPSWDSFIGNLNAYAYAVDDFQEFSTELSHSYKGGSTIEFHIHGAVNGSDGTDRTIKFEIEYSIADVQPESGLGDVYPSPTTIFAELTIPAATTDLTAFTIDIGDDTTSNFVQGAIVKGRIRRIASTGSEPSADPFLTEVGIHIESDTIGTRTATSK